MRSPTDTPRDSIANTSARPIYRIGGSIVPPRDSTLALSPESRLREQDVERDADDNGPKPSTSQPVTPSVATRTIRFPDELHPAARDDQ